MADDEQQTIAGVAEMIENWRNSPRVKLAPQYRDLMAPTIALLAPIVAGRNVTRDDLAGERMNFRNLAQISVAYFGEIAKREYQLALIDKFGTQIGYMIFAEWRAQLARARTQITSASSPVSELDLMQLHFGISEAQRERFANGTLTIGQYTLESPDALTLPHRLLKVPHRELVWQR